ncbi:hypothetical protein GBA52_023439 [Prunus armeniaca]|nr:hypothetical protein GBA52_023439 [Prunus armeniaca]
MEDIDPSLLGEFGVEEYNDVFYMSGSNYIHGMEWNGTFNDCKLVGLVCVFAYSWLQQKDKITVP